MSSAYRSAYDHIVSLKLEETREAREHVGPLMPKVRDVVQARIARILAGGAGIMGAAAMCVYAATTKDASATEALVLGSLAVPVSWVAFRATFATLERFRRKVPELTLTGRLDEDIARIEASDVRKEAETLEARANRLEMASVWVPFAGISLLAPLFLHMLVSLFLIEDSVKNYAEWIRISLVVVGHAHIALAILGVLFARKLHRSSIEVIRQLGVHREWAKIWGITIGVSCLPGLLLICIPPILVALTGLAFIPFLVMGFRSAVLSERVALAEALPRTVERIRIAGLDIPEEVALAEEQEREPGRDDHHPDADPGDRAQA